MKLREISEQTGITKRNIHFYIKEGLIHPDVEAVSGYYEFSEEDKKRMFIDLLPDLEEDDGKAYVSFYIEPEKDHDSTLEEVLAAVRELADLWILERPRLKNPRQKILTG